MSVLVMRNPEHEVTGTDIKISTPSCRQGGQIVRFRGWVPTLAVESTATVDLSSLAFVFLREGGGGDRLVEFSKPESSVRLRNIFFVNFFLGSRASRRNGHLMI